MGVRTDDKAVELKLQATELSEIDEEDIADIVFELECLVGLQISVASSIEIRADAELSRRDGVQCFYKVRDRDSGATAPSQVLQRERSKVLSIWQGDKANV
jgi:hypothetical protein